MLIPGKIFFLFTHFQILFIGYLLAKEFQRHQDQHLQLMRKCSSAHQEKTAESNIIFLLSCDEDNNCHSGKSLKELFSYATAKNFTFIFVQICADHLKRHESKKTNFVSYFIERKDCFKIAEVILSSCEKEVNSHLLKKESILLGTIVKDKVPLPFITSKKEFSRQFHRELYHSLNQRVDRKTKEDFKIEDNYFIPCFNFVTLVNFSDNCCCKCCLRSDISNYIMRKLLFKKIKRYKRYVKDEICIVNCGIEMCGTIFNVEKLGNKFHELFSNNATTKLINEKEAKQFFVLYDDKTSDGSEQKGFIRDHHFLLNRLNREELFSKHLFCICSEAMKVICKYSNELRIKNNAMLKYFTNFPVRKKRQILEQNPKHSLVENHDIKHTDLFNQHLYNRYHFLTDKYALLSSKLEKKSVTNSTNKATASENVSEKSNKYKKGVTISEFLLKKRNDPRFSTKGTLLTSGGKHSDESLSNSQFKNVAQKKNETERSILNIISTTEEILTKENSSLSTNNETIFDKKIEKEAYHNIHNPEVFEISNTFKTSNISLNSESKLDRKEASKMIYSLNVSRKNNSTAKVVSTNHPPISKNEFNFDLLNLTNFKSLDNNNESTSSIKFTDIINDYFSNEQSKYNFTTDSTHFNFDEMFINNKTTENWPSKKSSTITSNSKPFSDNFGKESFTVKLNGKNIFTLTPRNMEPSTSINVKRSPFEATDKIDKFIVEKKVAEKNNITNSYKFSTLTMTKNPIVNSNLNESTTTFSISKEENVSKKLGFKAMDKSVENGDSVFYMYDFSKLGFSEPYNNNNYGKENRVKNSEKSTLDKESSVNFHTFDEYDPKKMKTDSLTVEMDTHTTKDFTPKVSSTITSSGNPFKIPFISTDNFDFHRDEFTNHGTNEFPEYIQTGHSFQENTYSFSTLEMPKTISTKRSHFLSSESFGFGSNVLSLTQTVTSTSLKEIPEKFRTSKFNNEEMFTVKNEFNTPESSEQGIIKNVLPSEDSSSTKIDNSVFLETDANDGFIETNNITSIDDLNLKSSLTQPMGGSETEKDSFKKYSKTAWRNTDRSIIEDISTSLDNYFFTPVESTSDIKDSNTVEDLNKITTKRFVSDMPSEKITPLSQLPSFRNDRTILDKLGTEETEIFQSNMNKNPDAENKKVFLFTKYESVSTINDIFKDISTEKEESNSVINKNIFDEHDLIPIENFSYSSGNSQTEMSTNGIKKVTQLHEDRLKSLNHDGTSFPGTESSTIQNPIFRDDAENGNTSNEDITEGNKQILLSNEDEEEMYFDDSSTMKHENTGRNEEKVILSNKNEFSSKLPGATMTEFFEYDALITKDKEISSKEQISTQQIRTTSTMKDKATRNKDEEYISMGKNEFSSKIPDFIENGSLEDELFITKGEEISNIEEIISTQKARTSETGTMKNKVTRNTEEKFFLTNENEFSSKILSSIAAEFEDESSVTGDEKITTSEGIVGTRQVKTTDTGTIKNKIVRSTAEDSLSTDENEFLSKIPSATETDTFELETSKERDEKVTTSDVVISTRQVRTTDTSTIKNKIARSTEEEFLLTGENEFSSKTPRPIETELLELESSEAIDESFSTSKEIISTQQVRTSETSMIKNKIARSTEEEFLSTDENEFSSKISSAIDSDFFELESSATKNEKVPTSEGKISTQQVRTSNTSSMKNKISRSTEEEFPLTNENKFSSKIPIAIETELFELKLPITKDEKVSTIEVIISTQQVPTTEKSTLKNKIERSTEGKFLLTNENEFSSRILDTIGTKMEDELSITKNEKINTDGPISTLYILEKTSKTLIDTNRSISTLEISSTSESHTLLQDEKQTDWSNPDVFFVTDIVSSETESISIPSDVTNKSTEEEKNSFPSESHFTTQIIHSDKDSDVASDKILIRTDRDVFPSINRGSTLENFENTDYLKVKINSEKGIFPSSTNTVNLINKKYTDSELHESSVITSNFTPSNKEMNSVSYEKNKESNLDDKEIISSSVDSELISTDFSLKERGITNNEITNPENELLRTERQVLSANDRDNSSPIDIFLKKNSITDKSDEATVSVKKINSTEQSVIAINEDTMLPPVVTIKESNATYKDVSNTKKPVLIFTENYKPSSRDIPIEGISVTNIDKIFTNWQKITTPKYKKNFPVDVIIGEGSTTNKGLRTTEMPASVSTEDNKFLSADDSAQKESSTYQSITTNKLLRTTQRPALVRNEGNKSLSDSDSTQEGIVTYKSITTNKVLRTTQRPAFVNNKDGKLSSTSDLAQENNTTYKSVATNKKLDITQIPLLVNTEDNKLTSFDDSFLEDNTTNKSVKTTDLANGNKDKTYLSSERNILSSVDTASEEYITKKEYLSTDSIKEIISSEKQITSSTETTKPSLILTLLSQSTTNGEADATMNVKFQTELQVLSSSESNQAISTNIATEKESTINEDESTDQVDDVLIRTERQVLASSQGIMTSDTTRTNKKEVNTTGILQDTTKWSINNNNINISIDNSISMGRSDLSINSADDISTTDDINDVNTNLGVFSDINILTSEKGTSSSTEISNYPELNSDVDDNIADQDDKTTDQLEEELIRTERQISPSSEESQDILKSIVTGKDDVISKDDEDTDQIGNEIIPTEMQIFSTSQEIIPALPMTPDKKEANTIDVIENTSELNIENNIFNISSDDSDGLEETEISTNSATDISTNGDKKKVNINLGISTEYNAITVEKSTEINTETNINTELNSDMDDDIFDQKDGTTIQLDEELIRTEREVISSSQALLPSAAATTETEEPDTKNIFQTKNELSTLKTDLNMPTDRNVISEIPDISANNTSRDFPKDDVNGNINVNVDISTDLNFKTSSTDNFGDNAETNSELDAAEETSVDFDGMPTKLSPSTDTTLFMKPTTAVLTLETKTEKPLPTTTRNEIITNSQMLSSTSTPKTLSEANENKDFKSTITDIITSLLPTTIKPDTSTVDKIYSEKYSSPMSVSQLPETTTDMKFTSTASSATTATEKSTTSLQIKTTMVPPSSLNEDGSTSTFTTSTLASEISPIPFHFTINADYDEIVGSRKKEFEENLWKQLVVEMRLPFECIQNMEVSKGSIEVNFDLVPNPQLGHLADEKALKAAADELKRMIDSGQLKISDIEGNSLVVVPIDPPTKAPAATEQTTLILGVVIGAFILTVICVAIAVIIMKRKANGIHRLTPIEEARSKLPSYREIPFQEALFMKGPAKNKLMLGKYCYSTGKWLGPGPEPMSYIPPESAVYRPPTDSEVRQTPRPPTAVRERLRNNWELDWDSMVFSR